MVQPLGSRRESIRWAGSSFCNIYENDRLWWLGMDWWYVMYRVQFSQVGNVRSRNLYTYLLQNSDECPASKMNTSANQCRYRSHRASLYEICRSNAQLLESLWTNQTNYENGQGSHQACFEKPPRLLKSVFSDNRVFELSRTVYF